jgi:hypothetical protein
MKHRRLLHKFSIWFSDTFTNPANEVILPGNAVLRSAEGSPVMSVIFHINVIVICWLLHVQVEEFVSPTTSAGLP